MTNGAAGPVLVGASSWSARSLVKGSGWYPRRSMRAAERIAHYAARFRLVELDVTARFPPTPELCRQWAERTPAGFVFDLQAWSLLTGAATFPESLWADLQDEVRPEARDRRRLYASHLSADGMDEAWSRFAHALGPLRAAGRLGAVLLRYPPWLRPGSTADGLLAEARGRLAGFRLAVELPNDRWLADSQRDSTLSLLEELNLALVCVDGPDGPGVVAATSDLAVVRLGGRGAVYRADYRYRADELAAWVGPVRDLAAAGGGVHVLFANTQRDLAVINAAEFDRLVNADRDSR
ncbi:MAG: DUF72 domain-containing protein [Acidimicrobiales bacterium]